MIQRLPELTRSVHEVFRYCNVQPYERVVIFTDSRRERELADLFLGVSASIGCDTIQVWAEARPVMVEPSRAAIDAMKAADVVFDITTESWMYTPAKSEVMATGHVRMLQVHAPETMLIERPPHPAVIRRAAIAKRVFDTSPTQHVHVTSELGTDVTASYKNRPINPQDGAVVHAGEWDSQGMGFANCFPIEDSAEGTIVMNGPFHLAGGSNFIAEQPVTVTVHQGRITDIAGGVEARRFEAWLDSWDDPNMRVVAHLGIGYDHRAGPVPKPAEAGDMGAWESLNGGVVVAFGANLGRSGGLNVARSHCDLVLLGATFTLDGRDLVRAGECLIDSFADGTE
jgi:hypothetical protein